MRALAALVVRLIRTLHGTSPAFAEVDRYFHRTGGVKEQIVETATLPFVEALGSSIAVGFHLRSEIAICYQRRTFSCGQVQERGHGRAPEAVVDNFWIGSLLSVDTQELTSWIYRVSCPGDGE